MHARGKACRSGRTPLSGSWRVLAVPGTFPMSVLWGTLGTQACGVKRPASDQNLHSWEPAVQCQCSSTGCSAVLVQDQPA